MLVAESTNRFRATFAFGPCRSAFNYPQFVPADEHDLREVAVRSPILWFKSVRTPTYLMEGTTKGNLAELNAMSDVAAAAGNPLVHLLTAHGARPFQPVGSRQRVDRPENSPGQGAEVGRLDQRGGTRWVTAVGTDGGPQYRPAEFCPGRPAIAGADDSPSESSADAGRAAE